MGNFRTGNFGKVLIANSEVLVVTSMGDMNVLTPLETTWNFRNARGLVTAGAQGMLRVQLQNK